MLWLGIAGLAVAVLAILMVPSLRRRRQDASPRRDFDTAVYKDQLAEVDRDVGRGLISESEAATARLEIQRRLLAIVETETPQGSTGGPGLVIPALSVVVFAAALVLYLDLGSPEAPDFPYATRTDLNEAHATAEAISSLSEAVAKLEARLKTNPDDPEGWMMLGRSYLSMERYEDAQRAFLSLYDVTGDIQAKAEYAEALILGNGAQITPEALDIFQDVLNTYPLDPKARFYFGVAAIQQGNLEGAVQIWTDLLHLSPVDAPWVTIVRQQVQSAANEAGIDLSTLKPTDMVAKLAEAEGIQSAGIQSDDMPAPAISGPSQEDIENAQQMTADEQTEMIRSMVQRLADRLAADPNDPEGWLRLAKAYDVLGETEKAEDARRWAAEVTP